MLCRIGGHTIVINRLAIPEYAVVYLDEGLNILMWAIMLVRDMYVFIIEIFLDFYIESGQVIQN